ncbi:hypothetical protein RJ639_011084 [Escallonia herrerae]|uniref:NAC domain-containing protein n=1 Tax=Escallonia herrerae TaxID=1293975 RepID=A0AA89APR9_9ASTE|nr:hypothetical protein RJ639_011084 [Escallonia herrerae]
MAFGSSLAAISRDKNSKIPMASSSSLAAISHEKNGFDSDSYYWKKHLSHGQRFQPTLQELICFYLYFKFLPIQIPPGSVSSVDDIYDYKPYELLALAFKHDGGKMYFFTNLRKKFANDNKVKRDIKGNREYWKVTQEKKDVKGCTGTTVGTTTPLTLDAVKTLWLMTEHRLTDDLITRFKLDEDLEPMLCTMYYHIRKKESGDEVDGSEDPSSSARCYGGRMQQLILEEIEVKKTIDPMLEDLLKVDTRMMLEAASIDGPWWLCTFVSCKEG